MSFENREDKRAPDPGSRRGEWIDEPYGNDDDAEPDRPSTGGGRPAILLPGRRDLPE